jgi:L-asparaginase
MKTLVILTGGTFGSVLVDNGLTASSVVSDVSRLEQLSKKHFSSDVDLYFTQPFSKLSENIEPADWALLFKSLMDNKVSYDNVLIIHGTDTMAYTSASLSYINALSLNTTIVLTGANYPLSMSESDGPVNFIQSIKALEYFHGHDVNGCFIVFNGSNDFSKPSLIHLGSRVKKDKWSGSCYRSYFIGKESIGYVLGTGEVSFDLDQFKKLTSTCSPLPALTPIFANKKIAAIKIYPGLVPETLPVPSRCEAKFYIIELYNSGTAPADDSEYSLISWVEKVIGDGGSVFAVSQHDGEKGVYMDIYESSILLLKAGVIPLRDMIWESAIPKLMLAAQNFKSTQEVNAYMLKNICGEISDM